MEQTWQRDRDWMMLEEHTQTKCRSMTRNNGQNVYCRAPAVAQLSRRRRNGGATWWAYCGDHLYGREIRDGVVMHFVYRED